MKAPKWWGRHADAVYSGGFGFLATAMLLGMSIAGVF